MEKKLLFIVAPIQRCGSNFLARILCEHSMVSRPVGAFEWMGMKKVEHLLEFARPEVARFSFSEERTLEMFSTAFIDEWRKNLTESEQGNYILMKSINPIGYEHYHTLFPNAKLIILTRNGKDTLNSFLRASTKGKAGWFKRKTLLFLNAIKWRNRLKEIEKIRNQVKDHFYVTYEELTQDSNKVGEILEYLELTSDPEFEESVANLGVKGSNFYYGGKDTDVKGANTNWKEEAKTKDFKPVGRWRQHWSSLDKLIYDIATLFVNKKYR